MANVENASADEVAEGRGGFTLIGDADPQRQ